MKSFIRLANTHVKTRRLYYLYEMTRIIESNKNINPLVLEKQMRDFSSEYSVAFLNYKDSTGKITTKNAFKRYLNLALDLGLITIIEKKLLNTVDGIILSKLNFKNEGPYSLSSSLKIFFFIKILEKDFDYMKIINKLDKNNDITSSNFVKELENQFLSQEITKEKQDTLQRIKSWKSPQRYFRENIFAPRKSWLIDLDIISSRHTRGRQGFHYIDNRDVLLDKMLTNDYTELIFYLKNDFFNTLSTFLKNKNKLGSFKSFTRVKKRITVVKYLNDAFRIFQVKNRLSSKIFLNYFPIYSLCTEKVILEQNELEKELFTLSTQENSIYRYRPVAEISKNGFLTDAGYITR